MVNQFSIPAQILNGRAAQLCLRRLSTMNHDTGYLLLEEQSLPRYRQRRYYPVKIGDTFKDRYRVLAKLGYGAHSTVWLARDERFNEYSCLKVCVKDEAEAFPILKEVKMLRHLRQVANDDHPGLDFIRLANDIFQIEGQAGRHYCIAAKPQGVSVRTLQETYPNSTLPKLLVKSLVQRLLFAVNFLHVRAHVIHTDISPMNVLTEAADDSCFKQIENEELQTPSRPSIHDGHPIYQSRRDMTVVSGHPILTDFGQMRPADPINCGWCMPDLYRAPEVLLGLPWDFPVDLWSVGVMTLELLEGRNVFHPIDPRDNKYVVPSALAQYISFLGNPPEEMIHRSPSRTIHFDKDGKWSVAGCSIPRNSFEDFVTTIPPGEEKTLFLKFIRKMLNWDPELRATANELIEDEWLMMPT